ncbi:hypothetical protein HYT01_01465 [Candidatus Giovannonibacteria bacterium]|nr:hypothetical protein [Candidatus Giovannonibacteria bacterium]
MKTLVIKESALLSVILAAIETFKNECYLILLGRKKGCKFIAEYAFPVQTAKRVLTGIDLIGRREKALLGAIKYLPKGFQIIGDCHSHTERGEYKYLPEPTEEDKKGMKKGSVYIIAGITTQKSAESWRNNKEGALAGTFGKNCKGRYCFEIRAFWSPEDCEAVPIDIFCPAAKRLSSA